MPQLERTGARSQLWARGAGQRRAAVWLVSGHRTGGLFTGNRCQAVCGLSVPAGSHSGSTGPAQIESVRMELSSLASRAGGVGPQPGRLLSVSTSACRWGMSLASRTSPRERDHLGRHWEYVSAGPLGAKPNRRCQASVAPVLGLPGPLVLWPSLVSHHRLQQLEEVHRNHRSCPCASGDSRGPSAARLGTGASPLPLSATLLILTGVCKFPKACHGPAGAGGTWKGVSGQGAVARR